VLTARTQPNFTNLAFIGLEEGQTEPTIAIGFDMGFQFVKKHLIDRDAAICGFAVLTGDIGHLLARRQTV
jgi:hypothetical protein